MEDRLIDRGVDPDRYGEFSMGIIADKDVPGNVRQQCSVIIHKVSVDQTMT